ncbi:MAG: penicillin-binding transpeptidase domain-containing protein [Gemmatimonadales bacterium]
MAKLTLRLTLIEIVLLLGALLVLGRAAQLQLIDGASWRAEADSVRKETLVLPARRGGIYDRNGVALALTQEYFEVGVAPNELRERAEDVKAIAAALGMRPSQVASDVRTRKWIGYRGPFSGSQVRTLRGRHGVHLEGHYARHYPAGSLARGVIGALRPDSARGVSGVEFALDSALTGVPGLAVVLKDRAGRRYASPARNEREPVAGRDVYLTIDAELQEIAERAMDEAITDYEASGGDVVVLDPATGELLALASRQTVEGQVVSTKASFFTDPFEPGSTAKLFTAAALLVRHRVTPTDAVFAENGVWQMPVNSRGDTRSIHDAHKSVGELTLAQAIQVSSNIAMAKFADRLSAVEQFEALRDFGFGSPTGVEYPSEARGVTRPPERWDGYSKASIAMGYEFQVTPIQLAAAYGSIANNGILLTPSLVREVRDPSGQVLYRHQPEPVRRAVPPEVAATLRQYLRSVVAAGGTAEGAQLRNYSLIGKTGTAVRNQGGVYKAGTYTASFAAIFPAEDPQLVVIVKVDNPGGVKVFGGQTAAPITRTMLEEALAARTSAIDRLRLGRPGQDTATVVRQPDAAPIDVASRDEIVSLPMLAEQVDPPGQSLVPNVAGTTLRRAANALHRRGFKVAVRGAGKVSRTTPAAGESERYGTVVTVWAE